MHTRTLQLPGIFKKHNQANKLQNNIGNPFELTCCSPEETRLLGMRLGQQLLPGDVICLQGELGAGKTTMVQGLAAGWGSLDAVSSPTFVLVNVYRRPDGEQLFHFDTYRVESASEAEELDLESMLVNGALIIEWPERMESILPKERLWITLDYIFEQDADEISSNNSKAETNTLNQLPENIRTIVFTPAGGRYISIVENIRKNYGESK
ncbi:MAG: tRNA (adenosine(37)-N6)-threonylcarbamoyltransferase complex ATPase subunit type 1 TsaE [Chloroflexota bacterium]